MILEFPNTTKGGEDFAYEVGHLIEIGSLFGVQGHPQSAQCRNIVKDGARIGRSRSCGDAGLSRVK